jgi:hypothetical protein
MPKNPKKLHPDCLGISVQWQRLFFPDWNKLFKMQYEIHLQFYIFENDATGYGIIENLKKRQRVVKVYPLDGFGSFHFERISRGINRKRSSLSLFFLFGKLFTLAEDSIIKSSLQMPCLIDWRNKYCQ